MKNTSVFLKWALAFLFTIKALTTVFMFFSHELFNMLFPFSFTTQPFTIAYIFSKDKILVAAPLFAFIILPLCFLTGFILLFICKRKPLIPAIFLAITALSDIICMLQSIVTEAFLPYLGFSDFTRMIQSFGTSELVAGKIISIAFNALILALLAIYVVKTKKNKNIQK